MERSGAKARDGDEYLARFERLIGDQRTQGTFRAVIDGIIGGESLRAAVIARFSP